MPASLYHIIVADAQPQVRGLLARIVANTYPAATISIAGGHQEALGVFDRRGADLILTNHDLPQLDGLLLIQTLRARGATLPIVMLSADPSVAPAALAAGATRFVAKPFHVAELVSLLLTLLPA
ncbi:MAG TPA: response regulator [Roseiflexaceae bacterium]|nr:response regulator [Roseiflexaceae bacterium]